jgi:hypothetical protein
LSFKDRYSKSTFPTNTRVRNTLHRTYPYTGLTEYHLRLVHVMEKHLHSPTQLHGVKHGQLYPFICTYMNWFRDVFGSYLVRGIDYPQVFIVSEIRIGKFLNNDAQCVTAVSPYPLQATN